MRTTVTLDPDVARLLKDEAYKRGQSFKVALNEAVRAAFTRESASTKKRAPFIVRARAMNLRTGLDPARLSELADDLETEAFLRTAEKLRKKAA